MAKQILDNAITINLPDENRIVFSRTNYHYAEGPSPGVSLKFADRQGENYILNKNRHALDADEVLIVDQGNYICAEIESDSEIKGTCVFFSDQTIRQLWLSETNHALDKPEFIEGCFKQTQLGISLCTLSFANQKAEIAVLEEQLIFLGLKFINAQLKLQQWSHSLPTQTKGAKSELLRRLLLARDMLSQNLSRIVSLDELSTACCLSKFYLLKSFTKAFGCTPYRFHLNLRLDNSRLLLSKSPDLSVSEVALQSGFSDIHAFSKAYRKKFGYSPSQIPPS